MTFRSDTNLRKTIQQEIENVPSSALPDIYKIIKKKKKKAAVKTKSSLTKRERILALAGSWKDWDDEDFNNFIKEIYDRRSKSFGRKRRI